MEFDVLLNVPRLPYAGLLLHQSLPPVLWGVNPRTIRGKKWWDRVRRDAYATNDYKCWACGKKRKSPLEGHECFNVNWSKGVCRFTGVVALCWNCHRFIHSGHTFIQVKQGRISKRKYNQLMNDGRELIARFPMSGSDREFIRQAFGLSRKETLAQGHRIYPMKGWKVFWD